MPNKKNKKTIEKRDHNEHQNKMETKKHIQINGLTKKKRMKK